MVNHHQIEQACANFPEVEKRGSVLAESFPLCVMSVVRIRYHNGIETVEHPSPTGLINVSLSVSKTFIIVKVNFIGDPPETDQVAEVAESRVVAIRFPNLLQEVL